MVIYISLHRSIFLLRQAVQLIIRLTNVHFQAPDEGAVGVGNDAFDDQGFLGVSGGNWGKPKKTD